MGADYITQKTKVCMVFFDNQKRLLNPPSSCKDDGKRMPNEYYSNMKFDYRETDVDWIHVTQRPSQWCTPVKSAWSRRVPWQVRTPDRILSASQGLCSIELIVYSLRRRFWVFIGTFWEPSEFRSHPICCCLCRVLNWNVRHSGGRGRGVTSSVRSFLYRALLIKLSL
jgi:hypothetical protein